MDLARIGAAAQPLEKVPGVPGGFLNGAIAEPRKAGGGRRMCSKSQKKQRKIFLTGKERCFKILLCFILS